MQCWEEIQPGHRNGQLRIWLWKRGGGGGVATVPGEETGSWQVGEGVNHGDQQGDHHHAGIHDVQLGAEVNFEPKRRLVKHNVRRLTLLPDHTAACQHQNKQKKKTLSWNTEDSSTGTLKFNACFTFPAQFPLHNFPFNG